MDIALLINDAIKNNVRSLDLSNQEITALPREIGGLANLTRLYLRGNDGLILPPEIGKLTNLEWLDLAETGLTELTAAVCGLTRLVSLDLSGNRLTRLPPGIGRLTNLQLLHLDGNPLKTLPAEIVALENVHTLDVNGTALETPPLEVALRGMADIRAFFRQLNVGSDRIFEAKLLIVGEGGAGKTTLTKKIVHPDYQLRDEETTKGIAVVKWDFPHEGKTFRVNIWDFGGQEIYHETHQFFLTKRSLYALVADTRKVDTDFHYWLNVVELLSDESPLIIVKNEKQDQRRVLDEAAIKVRFRYVEDILATNLKDNRGLNAVLAAMRKHLTALPHTRQMVPNTWVDVRAVLENDGRSYIGLEEYLEICRRHGFASKEDALQLSGFLHDLGVFLHYQKDDLLSRTVILKPEWATDAVYGVLKNEKVLNHFGHFDHADLARIWHEDKYKNMHAELLKLMVNFKLCYQIPETTTYIAPHLLSEKKPTYPWDGRNNLRRSFKYEFMPKGILARLIVAVHDLIEEQERTWKSGVVLAYEGDTRAEVMENYDRSEIAVRVAGGHGKQLLAIVDRELNRIHASYSQLKFDTLIPCNCEGCKETDPPYFFPLKRLLQFSKEGTPQIQCYEKGVMVDVAPLIDGVADTMGRHQGALRENAMGMMPEQFAASEDRANLSLLMREHEHREKELASAAKRDAKIKSQVAFTCFAALLICTEIAKYTPLHNRLPKHVVGVFEVVAIVPIILMVIHGIWGKSIKDMMGDIEKSMERGKERRLRRQHLLPDSPSQKEE